MEPSLPTIGDTLGDYRIGRILGSGGQGTVYQAERLGQGGIGTQLALKILPPLPGDAASQERRYRDFLHEAYLLTRMHHPHIVTVFEVTRLGGFPCIVMELVEGEGLDRVIKARRAQGDPPLVGWCLKVLAQAAEALRYAHDLKDRDGGALKVIHRDIKPANMLLGPGGSVKLTDFGLARSDQEGREETQGGILKGSVKYMSPEQARCEALGPATDVFSLGVVLYEMITLESPFGLPPSAGVSAHLIAIQQGAREVAQRVRWLETWCPPLGALLGGMLAYDPGQRFASAEALVAAIEGARRRIDEELVWAPAAAAEGTYIGDAPLPTDTQVSGYGGPPAQAYEATGGSGGGAGAQGAQWLISRSGQGPGGERAPALTGSGGMPGGMAGGDASPGVGAASLSRSLKVEGAAPAPAPEEASWPWWVLLPIALTFGGLAVGLFWPDTDLGEVDAPAPAEARATVARPVNAPSGGDASPKGMIRDYGDLPGVGVGGFEVAPQLLDLSAEGAPQAEAPETGGAVAAQPKAPQKPPESEGGRAKGRASSAEGGPASAAAPRSKILPPAPAEPAPPDEALPARIVFAGLPAAILEVNGVRRGEASVLDPLEISLPAGAISLKARDVASGEVVWQHRVSATPGSAWRCRWRGGERWVWRDGLAVVESMECVSQ